MRGVMMDHYVLDALMRDLVGHDHRPSAYIVYVYLWTKAAGERSEGVALSYQAIADDTGLSKSAAQSAIRWLLARKLIKMKKASATSVPRYAVLRPWMRGHPAQSI